MSNEVEPVIFRATIPPIMSALRIGDLGARIQLDIPDSDVPQLVPVLAFKNKRLRVTIELDDES